MAKMRSYLYWISWCWSDLSLASWQVGRARLVACMLLDFVISVLMVQWVWFAEPLEIAEAIDVAWSRPRFG